MADIAVAKIDKEQDKLNFISQEIWKNPELSLQEYKAHDLLVSVLEEEGFNVQKNYILPTAFRAEISNGIDGPTVAVLCEYDALPEIGHGCGHNLIAEVGIATGIALKAVMDSLPEISGKVVVLGTPAEESEGGKVSLLDAGAFSDVDVAVMAHPSLYDLYRPSHHAADEVTVTFHGKEVHAAFAPWEGINALDGAVAAYNNLALLRQQIKPSCRIHALITEGGIATNIIPNRSQMSVAMRTTSIQALKKLRLRVEACIHGAAQATGCTVDIKTRGVTYENVICNKPLSDAYRKNAERLGFTFGDATKDVGIAASTDFGNVSHVVPCVYPLFSIPSSGANHTFAFTEAAGGESAQPPTLATAKALALTVLDILRDPLLLQETKDQLQKDLAEEMEAELSFKVEDF